MSVDPDMCVKIGPIELANPVLTASGTCGYADELAGLLELSCIGGFITKAITLAPWEGNPPARIVETDAGMLNAIGLANIGLQRFIAEKLPIIRRMPVPVIVNVAGRTVDEYAAVVQGLAGEDAIAGFELNVSCPNVKQAGMSFGTDPRLVGQVTAAARRVCGGKALIVKLTPMVTDITETARAAIQAGADALSLINTIPGMAIDPRTRRPLLGNRTGGLSGPAIRPVAVYLVHKVYTEVARDIGVRIIGVGGIMDASDAMEFVLAGASAVQVGTGTFLDPGCAAKVAEGLRQYCIWHKVGSFRELVGALV